MDNSGCHHVGRIVKVFPCSNFGLISDIDCCDYTLIHALGRQSDCLLSNTTLCQSVVAAKSIDYAECYAT